MGTQKIGGYLVWTPKKRWVIQCAKMQFQGKVCEFSVKIATISLNSSKCARSAQNLQFLCKI